MSKNNQRVLFFIRAYNDLDHFSPIIAEFLKQNEEPIIITYAGLDLLEDYRVKYLRSLGNIKIEHMPDEKYIASESRGNILQKILSRLYSIRRRRTNFIGEIYRKLFFDCTYETDYLKAHSISACVFEWGTPFIRGELIERFFIAAKGLGLKTIAIPHGCNVFLNSDVTTGYRKNFNKGILPNNKDRNLYDYYVLQNPIRRDGWIKWGYDPVKTQAWGSPRFYPDWAMTNKLICPQYSPIFDTRNKVKVVFMQFQKEYNIDKDAIRKTLKTLSNDPNVCLVVKDSTRQGKEYFNQAKISNELGDALVEWCGNEVHSPSLISWSDCVIVFGSSIGVEVLLQDKILINPLYLHTNKTLYEYYSASHDVNSDGELIALMGKILKNNVPDKKEGTTELLREVVYAGREQYDVPNLYFKKIRSEHLEYHNLDERHIP
jgi:hypothetical protein